MNDKLKLSIKEFARCHRISEKNPSLLVGNNWSEENSDFCAKNMEDWYRAEEEMLLHSMHMSNVPGVLLEYIKAKDLWGQDPDRHSSDPRKGQEASNRFFAAREKLVEYGEQI